VATVLSIEFKGQVLELCRNTLQQKMDFILANLREISESMTAETKSSAGDKHETARARMQAEQEKLGQQLQELEQQMLGLAKIDLQPHDRAGLGSLIKTDKGVFLIAVALGKISAEGATILVVSATSPFAQAIRGLGVGATANINGLTHQLLALC
jgi:hypothetical protein